jgi:hypothetical protein
MASPPSSSPIRAEADPREPRVGDSDGARLFPRHSRTPPVDIHDKNNAVYTPAWRPPWQRAEQRSALNRQAAIAAASSSSTDPSVSTDMCADNADRASAEPTLPRAQAACARTNGSWSASARESTGTASREPRLPSPTHTLRANPALPARRIAEPRENASHADSSSAVSSSAISEGEAVPGCDFEAPASSCTPNGGSPAARAANAGSSRSRPRPRTRSRARSRPFNATNFGELHGHTSWELCQLTRFEIPPRTGRKALKGG